MAQTKTAPDLTFERLASVESFAIGPVSYSGHMSDGEKDFRDILARSSAKDDFEKLFAAGNPQAKAYALFGLYLLNLPRFKELGRDPQYQFISLRTLRGCSGRTEFLTLIIGRIANGDYILFD